MTVDAHQPAPPTLNRRAAWATAAAALVVFVVLAAVLVPWDWVPSGELTPADPRDVLSQEQIARAEEFASVSRWLSWGSYAVSLVVASVLGLTPLGARFLRRLTRRLSWWVAVPVGALALLVIGRVATLPFSIAHHQRALDYGLSEQGWAGWAGDVGRSLLVGWVLTSLVLLVLVGLARWSPRHWFAWAGGAAAALTLAGSFLYPVVIEPVFNNFTSMQPGPFKESVFALADREGVEINDVLVADASRRTTTLNAYVSGFGGTRRVVVYDNLLRDLTPDEARVVIAHELAHAKHGDVLLGTGLGAVAGLLGVALLALALDSRWLQRRAGISGPGDPAALALGLALFALASLLVSPVEATISRAIEVRADRDSIAATGDGEVFVDMQRELATAALSDPTPPAWSQFWFGSHPTVVERAGLPASLEEAQ